MKINMTVGGPILKTKKELSTWSPLAEGRRRGGSVGLRAALWAKQMIEKYACLENYGLEGATMVFLEQIHREREHERFKRDVVSTMQLLFLWHNKIFLMKDQKEPGREEILQQQILLKQQILEHLTNIHQFSEEAYLEIQEIYHKDYSLNQNFEKEWHQTEQLIEKKYMRSSDEGTGPSGLYVKYGKNPLAVWSRIRGRQTFLLDVVNHSHMMNSRQMFYRKSVEQLWTHELKQQLKQQKKEENILNLTILVRAGKCLLKKTDWKKEERETLLQILHFAEGTETEVHEKVKIIGDLTRTLQTMTQHVLEELHKEIEIIWRYRTSSDRQSDFSVESKPVSLFLEETAELLSCVEQEYAGNNRDIKRKEILTRMERLFPAVWKEISSFQDQENMLIPDSWTETLAAHYDRVSMMYLWEGDRDPGKNILERAGNYICQLPGIKENQILQTSFWTNVMEQAGQRYTERQLFYKEHHRIESQMQTILVSDHKIPDDFYCTVKATVETDLTRQVSRVFYDAISRESYNVKEKNILNLTILLRAAKHLLEKTGWKKKEKETLLQIVRFAKETETEVHKNIKNVGALTETLRTMTQRISEELHKQAEIIQRYSTASDWQTSFSVEPMPVSLFLKETATLLSCIGQEFNGKNRESERKGILTRMKRVLPAVWKEISSFKSREEMRFPDSWTETLAVYFDRVSIIDLLEGDRERGRQIFKKAETYICQMSGTKENEMPQTGFWMNAMEQAGQQCMERKLFYREHHQIQSQMQTIVVPDRKILDDFYGIVKATVETNITRQTSRFFFDSICSRALSDRQDGILAKKIPAYSIQNQEVKLISNSWTETLAAPYEGGFLMHLLDGSGNEKAVTYTGQQLIGRQLFLLEEYQVRNQMQKRGVFDQKSSDYFYGTEREILNKKTGIPRGKDIRRTVRKLNLRSTAYQVVLQTPSMAFSQMEWKAGQLDYLVPAFLSKAEKEAAMVSAKAAVGETEEHVNFVYPRTAAFGSATQNMESANHTPVYDTRDPFARYNAHNESQTQHNQTELYEEALSERDKKIRTESRNLQAVSEKMMEQEEIVGSLKKEQQTLKQNLKQATNKRSVTGDVMKQIRRELSLEKKRFGIE